MEKIVGFVGYECEDIVIYLARILCSLGKNIAIVDKTEQGMLVEIMELKSEDGQSKREGEYCGVWITNQRVNYEEFDMVFFLFGFRMIHPKLYECGTLIMVTDGLPAHASMLRKVGQWECRQYLLLRNLVPMKHTEKYLVMLADKEKQYCEVPYDEQDIRRRCCLGSYADAGIKRLSLGMKHALVELVCFLTAEYPKKTVREIMKKI